jgi:tetratricopeptide (TPR) repeat protein
MTVLGLGMTTGVAQAQLEAPRYDVHEGSPQSRALSERASAALVRRSPTEALQMADGAIGSDPTNPWGHYNRAAALTDLGKVDEAVASFETAQRLFTTADSWGKSIAIYGRANALAQVGRCSEARPVFEEYARFVERADAKAAEMARRYASDCVQRP